MHIGLLNLSDPLWTAGQTFTQLLSKVLTGCPGIHTTLLTDSQKKDVPGLPVIRLDEMKPNNGLAQKIRRKICGSEPFDPLAAAVRQNGIDVVLPVFDAVTPPPCAVIGWIPDFQHHTEGDFFSATETQWRNDVAARVGKNCNRVLFSSRDAQATFSALHPGYAHRSEAVPFPSTMAFESFCETAGGATRVRYNIPSKFIYVPNQFWRHKNHAAVIKALQIVRSRGLDVHCVFTGLPHDSRDPQNTYLSQILQLICETGLAGSVSVLGFISRSELIDLFRSATLVIQPSLSEGWSTSVQDALAIGRPLICSDIAVHREQAPEALGFFPGKEPLALADLIAMHWSRLSTAFDGVAEKLALAREIERIAAYRIAMTELCQAAVEDFQHVIAKV